MIIGVFMVKKRINDLITRFKTFDWKKHGDTLIFVGLMFFGFAVRFWMSLTTYGVIYPDEFFQSTEIAHEMMYGYGIIPWEFKVEGDGPARSYFHPLIHYMVFLIGEFLHWDYFAVTLPAIRLLDITISAMLLPVFYFMTKTLTENKLITILATLLSALCYILVQISLHSFTDNLATPFTFFLVFVIIVNQKKATNERSRCDHLLVFLGGVAYGIAFMYRPFSVGTALPILLLRTRWEDRKIYFYAVVGFILMVALQGFLDLIFYGSFLITPWNVFKYNVLEDKGRRHIDAPMGWYISSFFGNNTSIIFLTIIIAGSLCLQLRRYWLSFQSDHERAKNPLHLPQFITQLQLLVWFGSYVIIYSFQANKQLRYIYPVIPVFMIVAAWGIVTCAEELGWIISQMLEGIRRVQVNHTIKIKQMVVGSIMILLVLGFSYANHIDTNRVDWNYYGDVVQAMEFVGQQEEDLTGLVVLGNWGFAGGYAHLHQNVSVKYYPNVSRFNLDHVADQFNYVICPRYQYNREPDLQDDLESHGFELIKSIDTRCDIYKLKN